MIQAGAPARHARRPQFRRLAAGAVGAGLVLALAGPAAAQGTTVVGDDGAQGDVIVNMDALNGGGSGSWGRGTAGGGGADRDASGELVEGPNGVMLRMPPQRPPQSRVTFNPDGLPAPSSGGGQAPELQAPSDQPAAARRQRADTERTAPERTPEPKPAQQTAAAPPKPLQPPQQRDDWARQAQADRTAAARETQPDTQMAARDDDGAGDATAPRSRDRRPERKPEPPQGMAADGAAAGTTQTADAGELPEPPSFDDTTTARDGQADAGRDAASAATGSETMADSGTGDAGAAAGSDTMGDAGTTADAGAADSAATGSGTTADSGADLQAESGTADDSATGDGMAEPDTATTQRTAEAADETAPATDSADTGTGTGRDTAGTDGGGADGTTQTARLPEGGLPEQMRLDFGGGSAELTPAVESTLTQLAQRLKDQPQQRIQLKAFASADGGNASQARRLSLSRALAVRSFLIDQGIRSTRMDVRALGNTADSGPLDRVDIVPATR